LRRQILKQVVASGIGGDQAAPRGNNRRPIVWSKDPSTGSGQGGALRVKRELEGGWFQWVAMPLPAVLTIQSGINQLRYATLKGIMAAKKKEIRKAAPTGAAASKLKILSLYVPEKGKKTQILGGSPGEAAKELVRKLRDEARVLS